MSKQPLFSHTYNSSAKQKSRESTLKKKKPFLSHIYVQTPLSYGGKKRESYPFLLYVTQKKTEERTVTLSQRSHKKE